MALKLDKLTVRVLLVVSGFSLRPRLGLGTWAFAVSMALGALCSAAASAEPGPAHFVIEGVPFVSWSDATRLDYPDKDVLNPSVAAAFAMIGRYWGHESISELMGDEEQSWGRVDLAQNASLGDLKTALRREGPIVVTPALTPWAHPMPDSALKMMQGGAVEIPPALENPPTSGLLGVLASFETLERIALPIDPFQEASRTAARVVIGFDDETGSILLHDPSFGPALEMPYSDFEQMWRAAGASYVTVRPKDRAAVPVRSGEPVAEPSPDQQALRHWVYGYALASIGRLDEAAEEFHHGLELLDIGDGHRHVLLLELALCQRENGDRAAAVETARRATAALPQHPVGWMLLGSLYAESSLESRGELARECESKAEQLKADLQALETAARTLPQDIGIRSAASEALARKPEGEGSPLHSETLEGDRQEERLVRMARYSLALSAEGEWSIGKPGDPLWPLVLEKELGEAGDPTQIRVQVITAEILKKSRVRRSGKENADEIFRLEQKTMQEEGVAKGLYELHGLSTGEEDVAGNHFFFMDYEAETATESHSSSLYLHFPQERHNEWFLMVHYTQVVPKTTGLREPPKASLKEVLAKLEVSGPILRPPAPAGGGPPAHEPGLGSIAVSIFGRGPKPLLGKGNPVDAIAVFFARLEEGEDPFGATRLVASNFLTKKWVFLLNAEPGRYVAVGGVYVENIMFAYAPPTYSQYKAEAYFSKDLILQTEVVVEPDRMTFMGDITVKLSHKMKRFDAAQRHYYALGRARRRFAGNVEPKSLARDAATEHAFRELARNKIFKAQPDWLAVIDRRTEQ